MKIGGRQAAEGSRFAQLQLFRSSNSSCHAIWMASSLLSLEAAGSPEKPGSSVIHLCMSVKRTVSGSVSGNLSVKPIAMSSMLSQPNVGGMFQRLLVISFFRVIFVPVGNFDDDVGGAIGNGLAAEARLWRDAGSHVQFVEFGVGGFVAGFEALLDDDVARGAGADAAAGVVEAGFDAFGNIENAAGKAVVAVGNFRRIDLDGFAARKKCDFIFLRGGRVFDFVDVRIAAAHSFSLLNHWSSRARREKADSSLRSE